VAASDAIAEEARALQPKGTVVTIANGCDFDDFAGLEYRPSTKLRITHTGNFQGKRDPKPFFRALAESGVEDVVVRFAGDVRAADREYAEALGLGDRIELLGYVSRRRSLELQRDTEVLLLLIPDAGGRGKGVLTGKIFEYLAAERPILAVVPPDGAAADLLHVALRLDLREGALERRRADRRQRHHDDPVPPRVPRERAGARGEVPAHERHRARLLRGVRSRLSRRLLGSHDEAGADAVLE